MAAVILSITAYIAHWREEASNLSPPPTSSDLFRTTSNHAECACMRNHQSLMLSAPWSMNTSGQHTVQNPSGSGCAMHPT